MKDENKPKNENSLFYLLSIKWTVKTDPYFTFWRQGSRGYAFYKKDFQTYPYIEAKRHDRSDGVVPVSKLLADTMFVSIETGLGRQDVILNNEENRKRLGIKLQELKQR